MEYKDIKDDFVIRIGVNAPSIIPKQVHDFLNRLDNVLSKTYSLIYTNTYYDDCDDEVYVYELEVPYSLFKGDNPTDVLDNIKKITRGML